MTVVVSLMTVKGRSVKVGHVADMTDMFGDRTPFVDLLVCIQIAHGAKSPFTLVANHVAILAHVSSSLVINQVELHEKLCLAFGAVVLRGGIFVQFLMSES